MDKKTRPTYMLSTRYLQNERYTQTKNKEMEKDISWKWKGKQKAGVEIFIYDKIDFKTKVRGRDKEGHYIMIKGTIQQEDIILVNIQAPKWEVPDYVKQILINIKWKIDSNSHNE